MTTQCINLSQDCEATIEQMATEGLAGVGEESPAFLAEVGEDDGADIGIKQSTTSWHWARRDKLHRGVRLHWKWTVSPEQLAGKFAGI
jgi:hypothetical protein